MTFGVKHGFEQKGVIFDIFHKDKCNLGNNDVETSGVRSSISSRFEDDFEQAWHKKVSFSTLENGVILSASFNRFSKTTQEISIL